MLSAWFQGNKSVVPLRIEIEVEVETQVKVDYAHSPTSIVFEDERPSLETYSHDPSRPFSGTAPLSPRADSYQSSSYLKQHNHIMSLPRSDYDPRRVCVNPCPNLTLGKHRRSIGVYLAGALVRVFPEFRNFYNTDITFNPSAFSSLLQTGYFWMLLYFRHTQSPSGVTKCQFMSLSLIGCPEFYPCSGI